jgi:hypothetical protein
LSTHMSAKLTRERNTPLSTRNGSNDMTISVNFQLKAKAMAKPEMN